MKLSVTKMIKYKANTFSVMLLLINVSVLQANADAMQVLDEGETDAMTIKLLQDILQYRTRSRTLVAELSCWRPDLLTKLVRSVTKLGMLFSLSMADVVYRPQEILFMLDLSCSNSYELLIKANKMKIFRAPYKWILLQDSTNNNTSTEISTMFESLDLLVDNELLVAVRSSVKVFDLIEMYKVNKSSALIIQPWGRWTFGSMQVYHRSSVVSARRGDLHGATITIANVVIDSETTQEHIGDAMDPEYDSITKRTYIEMSLAIDMMNGTRITTFTPSWGYQKGQENWTDMAGQLISGESNVGTACFMAYRLHVIDYIAPLPTRLSFLFRRPPLSSVGDIYSQTFQGYLWAAILIALVAAAAVLFVTTKFERSLPGGERTPKQMRSRDVYLMATSAIFQQGCEVEPQRISGRITTFVIFLSMMSLYAAYSANIVVLLRATSTSIRTLQDLLDSRIMLASSDTIYNRYYLPIEKEPVRKAIYDKKIAPRGVTPRFYSNWEGVARMREGMFAFNMEVSLGYRLVEQTYLEHEKCDLQEMDFIGLGVPWIPIEKHSPYKELFKINTKRIHEAGLHSRINSLLLTPKPSCSSTDSFSSVSYIDFYPAAVWMMYGFGLALAILFVEILVNRRIQQMGLALDSEFTNRY